MNIVSRILTLLGGIVLVIMIGLTCLSVAGRLLNGMLHASDTALAQYLLDFGVGPINGDFEMVEVGMAFAVFAFLPLCHLNGGHARVDVFADLLPRRAKRCITVSVETAFALVLCLIAVQLFDGMLSKRDTGQTSFLLEFPIWWGYLLASLGAVVLALVGISRFWQIVILRLPIEDAAASRDKGE